MLLEKSKNNLIADLRGMKSPQKMKVRLGKQNCKSGAVAPRESKTY